MTTSIAGLGFSVPAYQADQAFSTQFAQRVSCDDERQARKVAALYRRSGVETRGSVLLSTCPEGQTTQSFFPDSKSACDRGPSTAVRNHRFSIEAPRLACQSSQMALNHAQVQPEEITHLVTVSCTGFMAPGVDVALIDKLGLPLTTERVQVGFMGCHGAINGLRVANGLIAANPDAVVLMCCIELCSLHYQYGYDADRIVSGAIFADGSSGLVLRNESSQQDFQGCANIIATGSFLVPDSRESMTWKIGDHGFEMTLAATVPGLIESQLADFIIPWLAAHGQTVESIQGWAVHPGGSRILDAVENALDLQPEQLLASRNILAKHGNMSSATMPAVIEQFAKSNQPTPWVMLGFGPGLEIEVALLC